MSLRRTSQRIADKATWVCGPCQRAFSTRAVLNQERSSIAPSFTEILQNTPRSRQQATTKASAPTAAPSRRPPAATSQLPPTVHSPTSSARSFELASSVVQESTAKRQRQQQQEALADMARDYSRKDLDMQMWRPWKGGDVYAPFDLGRMEMKKWKSHQSKKPARGLDVFDELHLDPQDHWKNISMMTEYVSPMGRLKFRNETGLRQLNQRRVQRAVRRAVGGGMLLPTTYHHPELLKLQARNERRRN